MTKKYETIEIERYNWLNILYSLSLTVIVILGTSNIAMWFWDAESIIGLFFPAVLVGLIAVDIDLIYLVWSNRGPYYRKYRIRAEVIEE